MAEGINAATVLAELDVLDGEDKLVAGDSVVVSIGFTNAAVKTLAPREWEELAAYLLALIGREPVKTSPAFTGHRIVLGALATELRGFAQAAGEPVGLEADLRGATSKAEERRIRERLADQAAYFDRHIDDAIRADEIMREVAHPAAEEEPPADDDQPTETDDDPSRYL